MTIALVCVIFAFIAYSATAESKARAIKAYAPYESTVNRVTVAAYVAVFALIVLGARS